MFPAFVAAQDLDFDAQEIDRHIGFAKARHTHGVFLGGYDHFQIAPDAAANESLQLRFVLMCVIDVALGLLYARAKLAQTICETVGRGDPANRADVSVAQSFQRRSEEHTSE